MTSQGRPCRGGDVLGLGHGMLRQISPVEDVTKSKNMASHKKPNATALSPIVSDETMWSIVVKRKKEKAEAAVTSNENCIAIPATTAELAILVKDYATISSPYESSNIDQARLLTTQVIGSRPERCGENVLQTNKRWSDVAGTTNAATGKSTQTFSRVIQRPPPSWAAANSTHGILQPRHGTHNHRQSTPNPPPVTLRTVAASNPFNMGTLKSALVTTTAPSSYPTLQMLAACPNCLNSNTFSAPMIRDSSLTASVASLPISTDSPLEPQQTKLPPVGGFTLAHYDRQLHSLAEQAERSSAAQAELVLRDMIFKYETGLHDFQPDGDCYNRCVVAIHSHFLNPSCTVD
jgi:hypothetical protein